MSDRSARRAGVCDAADEARFGAWAVLAALAIGLIAVPFGLLLLMVESRWAPLLRIDDGARDRLHAVAAGDPPLVTMLGSWLLNVLVKLAVHRARPVLPDPVAHAGGMSFPSGHAQSATVAASVLILVFLPALRGRRGRRRLAVGAAVAWVIIVAFSRVGLGVHYVSDVVAGAVLGAAWVAATTALFSVARRRRGRPAVEPSRGLEPEHAVRLGAGRPSAE
jgi:undecaprenyl-diphosphatase